MAAAMNVIGLRRRDARQPRVQLRPRRCCTPGSRQLASRCSRANAVDARTGAAGLPAVRHQDGAGRSGQARRCGRHPRPHQPGCRDLGQGERRGQDRVPRHGRDGRGGCRVLRAAGADVVDRPRTAGDSGIVRRTATSCRTRTPRALIAEQVPGIDAILFGHAHREVPQRFVTNTATGPAGPAHRAVEVGPAAERDGLRPRAGARQLDGRRAARDHAEHQHGEPTTRRSWPWCAQAARQDRGVRQPGRRGTSTERCRRPTARYEDTRRSSTTSTRCRPTTVTAALAGTP